MAATGLISPLAAGDVPPRLLDVKGWRGTIVASVNGLENDDTYARHNAVMVCEVLVDEFDGSEDNLPTWRGRVIGSNLESSYQSLTDAATLLRRETSFQTSGPLEFKSGSQVRLVFHGARGWSFELTTAQRKGVVSMVMPRMKPRIHQQETADICGLMKPLTVIPYPANRMVLFGSGEVKGVIPISYSALQMAGGHINETWEWTAYFEPTSIEELKLEIAEPANYARWRPETTADREKGPPLEVTATLVSSKGGKPNTRVEKFIWELKGTSREPGVTLNFPIDQFTDDPDLELEARGESFVLSDEKQKMERKVRDGWTDTVSVVPFDWGAWSTLQVTAVLVDGRRVQGKLKGKKELGLLVPKRQGDSHIADAWKEQNKTGKDELDDENEPVGDGNKGDGFTLYEEYRGWIIDGKYTGGDPKKKDFFVLNMLEADGEPGIALFEDLSGFQVHTTSSTEEINPQHRVMNGNRERGAHVVDQHAVHLAFAENASALAREKVDFYGAKTVAIPNTSGVAFRPGITKIIGILPRGHAESLFTVPGYLPAQDAIFTFDRAVAHELMHSVGVVEHGSGDGNIELVFISPTDASNSQGRPYFADGWSRFKPVDIRDENKHDVAARVYVQWAAAKTAWVNASRETYLGKPGAADYPRMSEESFNRIADGMVGSSLGLKGLVGAKHGPHSGREDCIMRYHFARFYPMQGTENGGGFYMIAPGAERLGLELCTSADGTGVNAAGHDPHSRHGAAASGAGNCAAQICPNDAVPPRPSAF